MFTLFQKDGKKVKKICFVITSSIHYSRSRLVLEELRKRQLRDKDVVLQIVLAGSAVLREYGDIESLLRKDGFTIDARITMAVQGSAATAMAKTMGLGVIEFSSVFDNLNPDIVVVRGDRYEVLSAAVAAAYMNKTIAHIEGGDVSGNIDESVRHAITKLAHIHFTTNAHSHKRVIALGEHPDYVFNVGSSDVEFAALSQEPITEEYLHTKGTGARVALDRPFIIVMQHPVTSELAENRAHMETTLAAVRELGVPALFFWPNLDAGSDELTASLRSFRQKESADASVRFMEYLPPAKFIALLRKAACLVGNSSSGIKECSFIGVPVVNIGTRQAGRMRAENVADVPHDRRAIVAAIKKQIARGPYPPSDAYYKKDTSKTIARALSKVPLYTQKRFYD